MKKILFVLLLIPFLSYGQSAGPISNFHLENGEIQWRNTFEKDSLKTNQIIDQLTSYLPTVSGVSNVVNRGDVITGDLKNYQVNYKKYGGRNSTVMMQLTHPIDGKFTIQIKDGKYRAIVSDVYFTMPQLPGTLINTAGRKKNTEIAANSLIRQSLAYMNQDFADKFNLKVSNSTDW